MKGNRDDTTVGMTKAHMTASRPDHFEAEPLQGSDQRFSGQDRRLPTQTTTF